MRKEKIFITDYIPVGRENAIKRSDLREITGLTDVGMRGLIEIERLNGTPVINNGNGYFIADPTDYADILEVYEYIKMMQGKVVGINASIGALAKWLEGIAINGK